jgi:hypothetical protein
MDDLFNMEDGQMIEVMDHSGSENPDQNSLEIMPSDSELEQSKFYLGPFFVKYTNEDEN